MKNIAQAKVKALLVLLVLTGIMTQYVNCAGAQQGAGSFFDASSVDATTCANGATTASCTVDATPNEQAIEITVDNPGITEVVEGTALNLSGRCFTGDFLYGNIYYSASGDGADGYGPFQDAAAEPVACDSTGHWKFIGIPWASIVPAGTTLYVKIWIEAVADDNTLHTNDLLAEKNIVVKITEPF